MNHKYVQVCKILLLFVCITKVQNRHLNLLISFCHSILNLKKNEYYIHSSYNLYIKKYLHTCIYQIEIETTSTTIINITKIITDVKSDFEIKVLKP